MGYLDLPDVGCLKTLRTASDFELDPITFRKTLETLRLNGAVVDEYVLAALLRYEPIPLCIVEPLYLSLSHTSNLSLGGLQAPYSRHRGGVALRDWRANKKTPRELGPRGVCLDLSQSLPDSVCARTGGKNDMRLHASQSNYSTGRVTGREPFFVPSHPGIATEKRPAVPPATTTWISSVDGDLEIRVSGSRPLSPLP